ncbi:MAG: cell division protein ZapA [Nitrospirae bacterium]|nr:MAG: cell division protein ZapA [Nitrospirota bacterium]
MGSIDVMILGQKYTIKGDASEEHIKKLANFVDTRMKEVYNATPGIAPLKAAILASLDIADELHKLREEQENIARNIEERADVLTRLFD